MTGLQIIKKDSVCDSHASGEHCWHQQLWQHSICPPFGWIHEDLYCCRCGGSFCGRVQCLRAEDHGPHLRKGLA